MYPTLPNNRQYFKSTSPVVGRIYLQGWYGTFEYAPQAEVYLYDDDNGIVVFSTELGESPEGEQAGTVLTDLTKAEANDLIRSYSQSNFETIVEDEMTQADFYKGVWGGDKLLQKFNYKEPEMTQPEESEVTELG